MGQPKHVIVVGCLVRNDSGQVLLIRHHKRGWEIPQGRVEEGEDLLAAARREVLEETGVTGWNWDTWPPSGPSSRRRQR